MTDLQVVGAALLGSLLAGALIACISFTIDPPTIEVVVCPEGGCSLYQCAPNPEAGVDACSLELQLQLPSPGGGGG